MSAKPLDSIRPPRLELRLPSVSPNEHPTLRLYYYLLWILLIASVGVTAYYIVQGETSVWSLYNKVYLAVMLTYLWFIFLLLFWGDVQARKYPRYQGEKISVVIPCYNEPSDLLRRSLESVIGARGNKEIIVIDDGSTLDPSPTLSRFNDKVKIYRFEKNMGKRAAVYFAVKNIVKDSQFIVTMDSDTVLDRDALVRIVEPLKTGKIGAASGDVQLLNERTNLVTRMAGAYYWSALHIHRKGQSALGMVGCCSGALAGYKTDLMKSIIDDFASQTFFGEKCTYSEDRHLTNLVLQRGYNVVFIPAAIAYTETPETVRGFLKQQQRWRRGFIKESLYALTYAWKERPLLFFEILFWDLTMPFFSVGLVAVLLVSIAFNPIFFLTVLLPAWIMFLFVRSMPVLFQARGKIPGLLIYMLFSNFVMYWQGLYGLLTIRNRSWVTR